MKKTTYHQVDVIYNDFGEGPCIVLLHGYLESGEIWEDFAKLLIGKFRVIIMDLPGHGESGTWGEVHTMEELAGSVRAVLDAENLLKVFLVGHSMGGYVTIAFADLFPERIMGYTLFHSTCFSDTPEKRIDRDREISLVQCQKKGQIIGVNIPKAFADSNIDRLGREVDKSKQIALKNRDEGIIAILNGMKKRPDRTKVLKDKTLPLLLIGGMKDNYIPVEIFEKLVSLAPHAAVLRLENSGHMGFIEEPDKAVRAIYGMMGNAG